MIPSDPLPTRDPRLPVIDPPSLCEAGPCRNYHRMVFVLDAQDPIGERGPLRRAITRACYPSPGIEVELGDPVLQCSLWNPEVTEAPTQSVNGVIVDRAPGNDRDRARARFLSSEAGRAFSTEVATFEADAGIGDDQESETSPVTPALIEAAIRDTKREPLPIEEVDRFFKKLPNGHSPSVGVIPGDQIVDDEDLEALTRPEPIKEGGTP